MFMMLRLEILRPSVQIPHRQKSFGAINAREPTFNPWSSRFVYRFASCPRSSGGRSIRTIAKNVLEALLVIALFTTLIIGVMELKLAIWTPFFHR